MIELIAAFILGAFAWWLFNKLAWSMAFGGRKIGSQARQRWLAKLDYEALLRAKKQIDDEITKRQP
jgi:hypothetical protein